jgi:hypothetical protein
MRGCSCFAALMAAGAAFAQPASVAGSVANAVSGEPVARAHVMLRGSDDGKQLRYGALTDGAGKFSITGLPPATYSVSAERVGFETPSPFLSSQPVALAAGDARTGVKLRLTPLGSISGRVLGADGEPAEWVQVSAETDAGPAGHGDVTDDRGQFRIGGLAPGRYRLKASPQNLQIPPEIRSDGTAEVHTITTWFPNAIEPKTASRISVEAAVDSGGVEIRLAHAPIVRVSGTVQGGGNARIEIRRGDTSYGGFAVKPDGSFTVWRLDPGKYSLCAYWSTTGQPIRSAPVEISVADANIDGLLLRMIAPADIAGRLVRDDDEARSGGLPYVILEDLDRRVSVAPAKTAGDETFRLESVPAGRYHIRLSGRSLYVKTVRLGQAETAGPTLDMRNGAGGAALTLVVSGAMGSVAGSVSDDRGPAANARVFLLPEDLEAGLNSRVTVSAASGAYGFEDVTPGRYKLIALDSADGRSLEDFQDQVEHIEVTPRDQLLQDLTVPAQFQIGVRR